MSGPLPAVRACARSYRIISRPVARSFTSTASAARQGPGAGENFEQANDPTPRKLTPNVSKTNETPVDSYGVGDKPLQELVPDAEKRRVMQAPNRKDVWSRSQMPRDLGMSGPRFEQTIMEAQPRPYAAIELIHKQPVRWVKERIVACDGGGGALGHPRIFINVDKPQICWCTYCGLPYAHLHHKKLLESIPKEQLSYPLAPTDDPAQVTMPQSPTQKGELQGQFPRLKGEIEAESQGGEAFSQR
ncbi:hypothetical protein H2198_002212 [Neophaeococcomyces mojaviensis]|uniref:Uncharacterized protein n=1 Tax=Neophaeococcomyces mojaviensis TaxID=3383035 RepID=A0ACC3AEZ0_9EURO|nr:hypothetical protein H2198_002212 [Knufia sp. JES_112]